MDRAQISVVVKFREKIILIQGAPGTTILEPVHLLAIAAEVPAKQVCYLWGKEQPPREEQSWDALHREIEPEAEVEAATIRATNDPEVIVANMSDLTTTVTAVEARGPVRAHIIAKRTCRANNRGTNAIIAVDMDTHNMTVDSC
jgi:hypothetical protein